MPIQRICSIGDCGKPHEARGYCKSHYKRWQKHGDPLKDEPFMVFGAAVDYFNEIVLKHNSDKCLLWPFGKLKSGYGLITHYHGGRRQIVVHKLVCETLHGPKPPDKDEAAHSCGVRDCVNWRHIRWATYVENNADKLIHGTHIQGERQYNARLTRNDVRRIRQLLDAGEGQTSISNLYGVSRGCIESIRDGDSWAWLK